MLLLWAILLAIGLFSPCRAALKQDQWLKKGIPEGITVDLRDPLYSDGVLSTDRGGVIAASQIRIQALHLRYTRTMTESQPLWTLEAEGDLIVEFGDYVFVGEKLFYDFWTQQGVITKGKTAVEPWYFGGERLELRADRSCIIYEGYATTSEKADPDWGIYSHQVTIEKERYLRALQVSVRTLNYTVLWIPALRANLDSVFDNPIRYRVRWGGRQGPRFGLTYEIFSWARSKTFVRFDYRLTRGIGGGLETHYRSADHKTEWQSINYLAKDSSILHPHEKARYRFEGIVRKVMDEDKTTFLLTYDKISDKDMPSSYYDRDFDFDTSERTQLLVRRQEEDWIGHFYGRVRINSFQTILQELPTVELNCRPLTLGRTGIVMENWARASYLHFEYSKHLVHVHDYASTRWQYFPSLYRPIVCNRFFTLTPEIGMIAIVYGNTPAGDDHWLLMGKGGLKIQTRLYRHYTSYKHVIEPYLFYRYYSAPAASPHQHYVFDLSDGWTRLNYLSFGLRHTWQTTTSCPTRIATAEIYSFAFFDAPTIPSRIPCLYGRLSLFLSANTRHSCDIAWNFAHHQLQHLNMRFEWTVNADFAIACEYRHRGPYSWRKIDDENFFLEAFHSTKQLLHSRLSDRRDTLLLHLFYRFHPNWSCEFTSRNGWNRRREPNYFEYEINILTTLQTAWHLRLSFQHQENDNRIALYLNIGLKRPD